MVSTEYDFLFVHIPKTGGNAIQNILREYSEAEVDTTSEEADGKNRFGVVDPAYGTTKHATLAEYYDVIEPAVYSRLFKFTVLRNPWERMVSAYFSPHRGEVEWDPEAFAKFVRSEPPLRHYVDILDVRGRIARKVAQLSPTGGQWIKPVDTDIDFFLRFEHLNEGFLRVCEHIGIPPQELPVRNQSSRDHYSTYYTQELRDLVGRRFAEGIQFGRYAFGE